ncbi:MAG: 2'-deoxycytidine 5'-triphosphate deaminase, partial [SAR324 cluster bacterium]|nr:2'-deoxycytidine 5'-triphosphate deaminase [SAR324 cluster bacterium]
MILSDVTLRAMLESGELVIEPLEDYLIQPASIDLRLGRHFLKIDENAFDTIRMDDPIKYIDMEMDEIVVPPLTFMLASTMEY